MRYHMINMKTIVFVILRTPTIEIEYVKDQGHSLQTGEMMYCSLALQMYFPISKLRLDYKSATVLITTNLLYRASSVIKVGLCVAFSSRRKINYGIILDTHSPLTLDSSSVLEDSIEGSCFVRISQ